MVIAKDGAMLSVEQPESKEPSRQVPIAEDNRPMLAEFICGEPEGELIVG